MMNEYSDSIADELLQLTLENVEIFDRDISDGKGREFFETCQINQATVFRNKLSGIVGTYVQGNEVEVNIHGNEISSTCTCSSERDICVHAISLLYSWIFDGDDFLNIENVLQQIDSIDRDKLVVIVKNIIKKYPNLADVFLAKEKTDWYDIDPDPDLDDI